MPDYNFSDAEDDLVAEGDPEAVDNAIDAEEDKDKE